MTQLIVTRPLEQAEELIHDLKLATQTSTSFAIQHIPLLSITPISIEPIDFASGRSSIDGIIFISSNAAKYFYQNIHYQDSKTILIAVGKDTALTFSAVSLPTAMSIVFES
jgi:uroporphyrinogen-III synthase